MGLTVANGAPSRVASPARDLREAITSVTRAIEDIGWLDLSQDRATEVVSYTERQDLIHRCRLYARRNPLARQATALLVNYVLGKGITLTAANRRLVARIVDEFWESPVNRAVLTGHSALGEFLVGAFTDGAQYLVLFPDPDAGTVELGSIDALFVEDIVTDPDNWRVPLWYKVRRPRQGYDFKAGVYVPRTSDDFVWYRDWRNVKDDDDEKADDRPKGRRLREAERDRDRVRRGPGRVEEGLVYRARRGRGKHGYPEMAAAVDWLKAHRDFMEDRATISRAAASIAWRKKRKNSNAADVASEVARLRSSLSAASSTGYDRNPPLASGSTIVENESTSLEWVKTDTGGSAALADERILRMMTGSGMGGIPNHLFGDEAAANLATALAMNTPLLKAYENWQQWLSDIVQDLIGFVLETAHDAGRIGPRDDSLRYVDRRTVERPDPSQPALPPGQQPPRLPPGPPPAASVPIREQDAHVRTSPDRLADAPELASREAFHAAGNIDPGAPAARQAEAFDRLPADAYVWVFHATKEPVRPFLNDGLRPDNLPVNVARGELPPPEEGGPDLPPADRTGTSVTGTVRYARKWGPRVIAMRVRKGDIHLRPESEAAGLTVGEVIVGEDGGLVRRVSPSDLVALGSGGSDDTYRAVSDAVRRLREAFAPGQPPAPGTVVPGGAPGPTPGQPPLPPPPRMLALTTMDRDLPSKRDPVDWYVDVDFSPIMQQDIKPFVESLKVVGELLPSVPESQRLIVTMALTALGVNDLDTVLDRIFPVVPGDQPAPPLIPPSAPPQQGQQPGQPPPSAPPQPAPSGLPVREAERAAMLSLLASAPWDDG